MRIMQRMTAAGAALLGAVTMVGCVSLPALPGAAQSPTDTAPPKASATPNPTPTETKTPLSVAQLRSLIGSLTAKDGLKAQLMDDDAVSAQLSQRAFGAAGLVTEPAECLGLLRSGALSDYRVPTAVGIVGPPGGVASIQVSYEDSGLYWEAMHDIGNAISRCSPMALISPEGRVEYALNVIPADLHGTKTISVVATFTAPDGSQVHVLRSVAMDGSIFVTAETSIPGPFPTASTRDELTGYVNAIIDNADDVANLAAKDPAEVKI